MGLLSEGEPLSWPDTKALAQHVRIHGANQFVALYERLKNRQRDSLLWGDEVEFTLVEVDHEAKTARLTLRAEDLLKELQRDEEAGKRDLDCLWRPEYASYMLEATPGKPYTVNIDDLNFVERNMRLRRRDALKHLGVNERLVTCTGFPRLGCNPFTSPDRRPRPQQSFTRSLFWPDEATYLGHPRFKTLTRNIRERRGEKVAINVPIFKDSNTRDPMEELPEAVEAAKPNHIYMDAMGFGMGMSCLQVTFQATNLSEAVKLYDQLAPLCPIFLALTASSPFFRGYVGDWDARWDVISASVDCRTPEERIRIPKSRYASISSYLSDCCEHFDYNDVPLIRDESVYALLKERGIEERMARHVSHLFIRDTVSLFSEKVHQNDDVDTDHFENIQSTNWQTMRFKPPPPNSDIGWRVEFRPCELQLNEFENAATVCFLVLLTRAILSYDYNLLVPISKVDENMSRAHKRDAINKHKFYFRTNITSTCKEHKEPNIVEMSLNQIINGDPDLDYCGLLPLVQEYLRDLEVSTQTMCTLSNYFKLIRLRASGELSTNAKYLRDFVLKHPEYKGDSKISERINYDLIMEMCRVQEGEPSNAQLFGDIHVNVNADV